MDKFIIGIVITSFVVLAAGIFLAGKIKGSPEIAVSQNAKAQIGKTKHDWGEIKLKGGDVKKIFVIKNAGTGPLKLANIKTSCMCTTARVKIGGEKSPYFGMHSNSSWVGQVLPGGEAKLEVIFDPAYHGPSGIGPIEREVTVETNDPNNRIITFNLSANVVN